MKPEPLDYERREPKPPGEPIHLEVIGISIAIIFLFLGFGCLFDGFRSNAFEVFGRLGLFAAIIGIVFLVLSVRSMRRKRRMADLRRASNNPT